MATMHLLPYMILFAVVRSQNNDVINYYFKIYPVYPYPQSIPNNIKSMDHYNLNKRHNRDAFNPERASKEKGYKWVNASHGHIPLGAFVGGRTHEGKALYVVRAKLPYPKIVLLPGRFEDGDKCVSINHALKEYCIAYYDVLIGNFYTWVLSSYTPQHPDKVVAGYEDNEKNLIYVCRKFFFKDYKKFDAIGKQERSVCTLPYSTTSLAHSSTLSYYNYQLLVGAADTFNK